MTFALFLGLLFNLGHQAKASEPTPSVTSSSIPIKVEHPPLMRLGHQPAVTPTGRSSIGLGVGLSEGKPLEMLLWGGTGAVIGSFAGPVGAAVGGAAGAAVGLIYSVFVVPRIQTPESGTIRQRE